MQTPHNEPTRGSRFRLRSIAIALAGIALSVITWQVLRRSEKAYVTAETKLVAETLGHEIVARLDARAMALRRMALDWEETSHVSFTDLEVEAAFYEQAMPGYHAIGWIDPAGRLLWVAPLVGNEKLLGSDFTLDRPHREAWEQSRRDARLAGTTLIDLTPGTKGFLVLYPIFARGEFHGNMTAVFTPRELFDGILASSAAGDFELSISDGTQEVYARLEAQRENEHDWAVTLPMNLYGNWWQLKIWPTPAHLTATLSRLPEAALLFGLALTLFLTLASLAPGSARARSLRPQELAAT